MEHPLKRREVIHALSWHEWDSWPEIMPGFVMPTLCNNYAPYWRTRPFLNAEAEENCKVCWGRTRRFKEEITQEFIKIFKRTFPSQPLP